MKILFEDTEYDFDIDEIDVAQARYLQRRTGKTLLELEDGAMIADADCLVAYYWLMKAQNGVTIDMDRVNFKILKFGLALGNAMKIEADAKKAAAEAENPTGEVASEAPGTT